MNHSGSVVVVHSDGDADAFYPSIDSLYCSRT